MTEVTETMWLAMRGRRHVACAGCGQTLSSPSDTTQQQETDRAASHSARCAALEALDSLTDEERNMSPHERHALWQSDARGRNVRIRCTRRPTAQEERRSLLREHADGSCHDTRLDWWPAGSWRRK